MSTTVGPTLSDAEAGGDEFVARAAQLVPVLRENCRRGDAARRYPEDMVDLLRENGMFNLFTPREYGGFQVSMTTYLDVAAELSRGDAAAGWLAIVINGIAMQINKLSAQAKDEVWGNGPDAKFCGTLTPSGEVKQVDGGYVITGEFGWGSGSDVADWAVLAVLLPGDDGELRPGAVFVPRESWTIKDTWYTLGMRGTGSNTIVVEDAFVPDYRVFTMLADDPSQELPYSVPMAPFCALWPTPVPLGIARNALDIVRAQLPERGAVSYSAYQRQMESTAAQMELAHAAVKIDVADALLHKAAATVDDFGRRSAMPDLETRARIKMQCAHAAHQTRQAVNDIVEIIGASAVADFNPLQQVFRDMSTATLHGLFRPSNAAEVYGRVLVGLDPEIALV